MRNPESSRPAVRARPPAALVDRYRAIRATTMRLVLPLAVEDMVVQSMPDCSPVRWHLAHTTWFFETFVLKEFAREFRPFHPEYERLFNSYYQAVGTPLPRDRRGVLSRPTVSEVREYRAAVDERMGELLETRGETLPEEAIARIALGLEHEQQHQELILTDVKHALAQNPLLPAYRTRAAVASGRASAPPLDWVAFDGGLREIGHDGDGFGFDNESPRHRVHLEPFQLASRLVTNAEFDEFIAAGGYRRPEFWLADGFAWIEQSGVRGPLYRDANDATREFTLDGPARVDPAAPVCHVSHFEADAYARFRGARLPSEAEWEVAASALPVAGNFLESDLLRPAPARSDGGAIAQLFGDVWEWTRSAYSPYPGFRAGDGAIGEYNGKFMVNQTVLRGGSCVTPRASVRASYRNFFPSTARWQFTGIRLAADAPR